MNFLAESCSSEVSTLWKENDHDHSYKYSRGSFDGFQFTFYVTMAAAGYVVEFLFAALGIIPQNRNVVAITEGVHWNYTTALNIIFLIPAAILVIRFVRAGGSAMLKMMNMPTEAMAHQDMD